MAGDSFPNFQSPNASSSHDRIHRSGRLRASTLKANDGIVSTARLMIGVAESNVSSPEYHSFGRSNIGRRGNVDGGGGYVSVKSQADSLSAGMNGNYLGNLVASLACSIEYELIHGNQDCK
ncbi:MAG: VIT1/CCC1 family predicted Fe2+/Mn2+ transporter [Verrucomicrobiales bacterium]|jgi:VIT1/CCC1 family predicted Fe2+/Mn2+ transporter